MLKLIKTFSAPVKIDIGYLYASLIGFSIAAALVGWVIYRILGKRFTRMPPWQRFLLTLGIVFGGIMTLGYITDLLD